MKPPLRICSAPFRGYWTGTSHGLPVIIGFLPPGLVIVTFDAAGQYRETQQRSLPAEAIAEWSVPPVDPTDNRILRPESFRHLHLCQSENDFHEGDVAVFPFDLRPDHDVALDYTPEQMKDILRRPNDFDPEEVEEARDYVEAWEDWYAHSFTWGVEYLLDPQGWIRST